VHDGQVAVDTHQRHGEDAGVQVDAPERVHQPTRHVTEHPPAGVRAATQPAVAVKQTLLEINS